MPRRDRLRRLVGDDYGADTGATWPESQRIGSLSPGAGDESYPEGDEATADLIRLTLRVRGERLRVRGLLHALYEADSTVLAVAIDTDADKTTRGGEWGELGVSSEGWEENRLRHGGPDERGLRRRATPARARLGDRR